MSADARRDLTLPGGLANRGEVVRRGDTVRRPGGPHTATINRFLAHLHAAGFDGAPAPLGIDDQGRQVLKYVPGQVPHSPLPAWARSDDALASLGSLLRRYHAAAATFRAPAEAVWRRTVPSAYRGLLVGHNDACVGNIVFHRGAAVALLDFDDAAPGTPDWDLAICARHWVPLLGVRDRDPEMTDSQVVSRLRLLCDAYGAETCVRRSLAQTAVDSLRWSRIRIRRAARSGGRAFGDLLQRGYEARNLRASLWLATHAEEITTQLVR